MTDPQQPQTMADLTRLVDDLTGPSVPRASEEYAALLSAIEKLVRDAERYRWLESFDPTSFGEGRIDAAMAAGLRCSVSRSASGVGSEA